MARRIRRAQRDLGAPVGMHDAIKTFGAHPGNDLSALIGRDVGHLVADVHVPVDSRCRPGFGVAAADLHQQIQCPLGGLFTGGEVGVADQLLAVELLRPVALLTGFLRRTQVLDRRVNRARELVEEHGVELVTPRELRLDEPVCPRADVTLDASHSRVGRVRVRGVLRFHRGMTTRATELVGLHRLIGLEAAEARKQDQSQGTEGDERQRRPMARIVEVEDGHPTVNRLADQVATMLPPDADRRDRQPGEEHRRHQDERQDAHVRTCRRVEVLEHGEEDNDDETDGRNRHADHGDWIDERRRKSPSHDPTLHLYCRRNRSLCQQDRLLEQSSARLDRKGSVGGISLTPR